MTDVWGSLGQSAPAATTLTDIYTVPANQVATVEVVICETGGAAATVRLAHAVNGAADTIAQYMLRNYPVAANDSKTTTRFTARAGDVIRGYSDTGNVSFNVNGIEENG